MALSRSSVVAMIRGVSWPLATWMATIIEPKVNTVNAIDEAMIVRHRERALLVEGKSGNPAGIKVERVGDSKGNLFEHERGHWRSPDGGLEIALNGVAHAPVHLIVPVDQGLDSIDPIDNHSARQEYRQIYTYLGQRARGRRSATRRPAVSARW